MKPRIGSTKRQPSGCISDRRALRTGVAAVECAVVLGVTFMLICAVFDFGLAVYQYNSLSAACRRVAREASIRGSAAPPQYTSWGPAAYAGNAADGSEIATTAAPLLATMPADQVQLAVTWPSGTNTENDPVQVTAQFSHQFWTPFLAIASPINLQAQSTMPIVH